MNKDNLGFISLPEGKEEVIEGNHKKRKKDTPEELRSGFVSTSAGKQCLYWLWTVCQSATKLPASPSSQKGLCSCAQSCPKNSGALTERRLICNAFLQHNFPALQLHKDASAPICDFNHFYFLHLALSFVLPHGLSWAPRACQHSLQAPGRKTICQAGQRLLRRSSRRQAAYR